MNSLHERVFAEWVSDEGVVLTLVVKIVWLIPARVHQVCLRAICAEQFRRSYV